MQAFSCFQWATIAAQQRSVHMETAVLHYRRSLRFHGGGGGGASSSSTATAAAAMIHHLQRRIVSLLLLHPASPHPVAAISPRFSPRLLSTTARHVSPKPFAAEDYLVAACGLTRAQAAKASEKISHLRSPSKPDAVLAFLAGLGISRPDIATAVAADPRLLCADVEKNLAKRVSELGDLGIPRSQIARLVPLARIPFRTSSLATNLAFWLPVFGSFDSILKALRMNSSLLSSDLDKVVKPNLAFLKQCGINARDVASHPNLYSSRLLTLNPKYLRDAVIRVEELGLDRGSRMFHHGLIVVAFLSKEAVAKKIRLLEELGFSQDDVLVIFRKMPPFLTASEKRIQRAVKFLKGDVGLEERYIAQRPVLLLYSVERRLLPRYYLLKVLRTKGLLNCKLCYYSTAVLSEKKFVEKFVHPYKDRIAGLADAYASICSGKVANGVSPLLDRRTGMQNIKVCDGSSCTTIYVKACAEERSRRRDAMIHLRRCVLSRLLRPRCSTASAHADPLLSLHLHRLLSSAAAEPIAVEDCLVESCGLTRAQAEKVSGKLSHLRSPSNPDAVLAFLSGLGLTRPDIAFAVASDPRLLCARVDRTLDARVAELGGMGLSRSQIARLIPLARGAFRTKSLCSKLAFLLTVFGSFDRCLEVVRMNCGILSSSLEKVIKPNLVALQQCGLTIANWPSYVFMSRSISRPTKHLEEAIALAKEFGLKPGTRIFAIAVVEFAILSQEKLTKRLRLFKKLGWSHEDLSLAVKNMPNILAMSEERVMRRMKFLTEDIGLEILYIAQRPALMMYSIERRLLPRHCLINVLKRNGLLKINYDFYSTAMISNKKFLDKFVHPYVESIPGLGDAYASSCAGCGVDMLKLLSKDKIILQFLRCQPLTHPCLSERAKLRFQAAAGYPSAAAAAAMIHLRRSVLARLLHPPCPTPDNPLPPHRLLSRAAPAPISPEPFAVEDYLVESCGLTRARAKKVSGKLPHLRSPSNPDAVLAFLSGLGLSRPDIAAVVVNDPRFICARVDKTLATRVAELRDLGLSRSQIARLIPVARSVFRCKSLAPKLAFLLTEFGSFDRCLEVVKNNYGALSSNIETVIKPNLAVLKECGISIANWPTYAFVSWVISRPTKHLEQAVVRANEFGAKQGSRRFAHVVVIFGILGQEKLAKKLELFKKLGWSQDDLSLAVRRMPHILALKEERVRRSMKFLAEDVGLEIPYIARRPTLVLYSIERRLLPRYCLINVLKGNGLLKTDYDFYYIARISNDSFMDKFVQPYVESVPGLGDAYASSCAGCGVHQLKLLSKHKRMC
uniref:Uncharacterized protein n=1 Tax=Oryza punctata TaxID=4537 RepID=A0A0E0L9I8_ORYPU